jgi:hypothetical protein
MDERWKEHRKGGIPVRWTLEEFEVRYEPGHPSGDYALYQDGRLFGIRSTPERAAHMAFVVISIRKAEEFRLQQRRASQRASRARCRARKARGNPGLPGFHKVGDKDGAGVYESDDGAIRIDSETTYRSKATHSGYHGAVRRWTATEKGTRSRALATATSLATLKKRLARVLDGSYRGHLPLTVG